VPGNSPADSGWFCNAALFTAHLRAPHTGTTLPHCNTRATHMPLTRGAAMAATALCGYMLAARTMGRRPSVSLTSRPTKTFARPCCGKGLLQADDACSTTLPPFSVNFTTSRTEEGGGAASATRISARIFTVHTATYRLAHLQLTLAWAPLRVPRITAPFITLSPHQPTNAHAATC